MSLIAKVNRSGSTVMLSANRTDFAPRSAAHTPKIVRPCIRLTVLQRLSATVGMVAHHSAYK